MFKRVLAAVGLMIVMVGCVTMQPKDDAEVKKEEVKKEEVKKEETVTRDDPSKMKVTVYGADKEVQAVEINGKTYYVLGGKDVESMTEQEIKSASVVAPIKVTEENIKGVNGIVVTYYDVKIFLGKRSGLGTTVGLFEPQKNDWTVGDDIDRSQAIQIKLSRGTAGPIDIKRGSISLSFN